MKKIPILKVLNLSFFIQSYLLNLKKKNQILYFTQIESPWNKYSTKIEWKYLFSSQKCKLKSLKYNTE